MESVASRLDELLGRFFASSTTNSEKQEIERHLLELRSGSHSIDAALLCLRQSSNHHVLLFCLQTIQELINSKWYSLHADMKLSLKSSLVELSIPFWRKHPSFLSNKYLKMFAEISCLEWPERYPDFFDSVCQAVSSTEMRVFGLKLLYYILESTDSSTPGILSKLFQQQPKKAPFSRELERITSLLSGLFDQLFEMLSAHFLVNFKEKLTLPALNVQHASVPVDASIEMLFASTNLLLQHSGVTLDIIMRNDSSLLRNLYLCASLGVTQCALSEISVNAVNCLIEFWPRPFASNNALCESHVMTSYEFIFYALDHINTVSCREGGSDNALVQNATYIERVLEATRVFFQFFYHRIEPCTSLRERPIMKFLEITLVVSLKTANPTTCSHMEIWQLWLDYLAVKADSRVCDIPTICNQFGPVLTSLMQESFKKIILSVGLFDSDDLNSTEEESEWVLYCSIYEDIVAKISDFLPQESFLILKSLFDERFDKIKQFLTVFLQADSEIIKTAHEMRAICRLITKLSHLWINESFWTFREYVHHFVHALVTLFDCFSNKPEVLSKNNDVITPLMCQVSLCVRSLCHWLAQFYAEAQRLGEFNADVSMLITPALNSCIRLLDEKLELSGAVQHANISLLYSLLTTIRPHYVLHMPTVQKLIEKMCHSQLEYLGTKNSALLKSSLLLYLLLPWFQAVDEEQNWKEREKMYVSSMEFLCKDVIDATSDTNMTHVYTVVSNKTLLLVDLFSALKSESSKTKKIAFAPLKSFLGAICALVGRCSHHDYLLLNDLLLLLHGMLECFLVDIGVDKTKEIIRVLVGISTTFAGFSNQLFLEHLLKCLLVIVKEHSKFFSVCLPDAISLLLNNVKPVIEPSLPIDVLMRYYEVLFWVVDTKWRYFFRTNVLISKENSHSANELSHGDEFLAIFSSFLDSFSGQFDMNVIKQNLRFCNTIHLHWALYKKNVFEKELFVKFVQSFMNLCVHSNIAQSLTDDVIECLSEMICASHNNQSVFYNDIVPQIVNQISVGQRDDASEKVKPENAVPVVANQIKTLLSEIACSALHSAI